MEDIINDLKKEIDKIKDELNVLKQEMDLIKNKKQKNKKVKKINKPEKTGFYKLIFYKNDMFNSLDLNYVKFIIIENLEMNINNLNLYFIEDIEIINTIDIINKEKGKIILNNKIKNYKTNKDGFIIKKDKLNKIIEELQFIFINEIKMDEFISNININEEINFLIIPFYVKNVVCDKEYLKIMDNKEIENFVLNTANSKIHPEGILICYTCREFQYYDKNMYRFEIRSSIDKEFEIKKELYGCYYYEIDFNFEFKINVVNKIICSLLLILLLKNNKGFYKERKIINGVSNFRQCYFVCDKKKRNKIFKNITNLLTNKNENLKETIINYLKKNKLYENEEFINNVFNL